MSKIAIIGCGQIGTALAAGLISGGVDPDSIYVTNRRPERSRELKEQFGVHAIQDNLQATEEADVVFLAVKPAGILPVLDEIGAAVEDNDKDTIVVSMAAGLPLSAMECECAAGTPLVRVMPNTPMLVGKGVSIVSPGRFASKDQVARVTELLEKVGYVEVMPESDIDVATAVSGSAPAYFFMCVEAMIDAAVNMGLRRDVATALASRTLEGSGALLASGLDPVQARVNVTSPGGTTAAALRELERNGIRSAFADAMEACYRKAAGK